MKHVKSLIVFLVVVFAAAALGATAKPDAWFQALAKPAFNPPAWVFAPVWTVLYVAMAIAAWRVYVRVGIGAEIALWGAQLLANAIWSPLFFGLHAIRAALVDIVILAILVVATAWTFARRDRIAGWLMAPYAAWVAFAAVLNAAIVELN